MSPASIPTVRHFAINADDTERARAFYSGVFGWTFQPWGPPGFFQVADDTGQVKGALQQRRELAPGLVLNGFEVTIGVEDVDAVAAAVSAHGGTLLTEIMEIPTVGRLVFFRDPEGNVAAAMQFA